MSRPARAYPQRYRELLRVSCAARQQRGLALRHSAPEEAAHCSAGYKRQPYGHEDVRPRTDAMLAVGDDALEVEPCDPTATSTGPANASK